MTATPRLRPLAFAVLLCAAGSAASADLMQAYELARASDPQLAAAEASSLATGEGVNQTRAALLPQIGGSVSLTDSDGTSTRIGERPNPDGSVSFGPTSGFSDTRTRQYSIRLDQSIYDHGDYMRLRASRARANRAEADYQAASQALALRVSENYFDVLTAIDGLVFARAERRAVKRQLDQAEQRFEVGLTAITDVHEARARYDSSRAAAIAAENRLDDARELLAEITGQYLRSLKGLGDTFRPAMPEPVDAGEWVASALANSPTLLSRELALQAANHDISSARSGHLPTLSGFISRGDTTTWGDSGSNSVSFPANSGQLGTTVGVTLTVPIFSGGLTQSQVRQAIHNRDAVEDQYEQERRAVTRTARNAFRALQAGMSEIGAREQALVSARSALEATEAGFEVGTRTIVDVLLSQQQLFQAQRDYSQSRHNFLVNTLRLKQAAGVVGVDDIKSVNALLVTDAEAPLADSSADAEAGAE
ncbi:TolC family outer membrane protein [Pseudomarimonas salicorniae]|uniref:TolC family outer membrane protein n=1 Tax=Pseudomarimonas salicorniae TaxID=2933270 RepID=A0ABT0GI29_9GAMM|nr:TolC family outer membrane protein [Lysobacter sp. CAU 1642]MCK7594202.1 TolC family outer membrane protein [Lysobacter sp. CAU 1642]